MEPTVLVTGFMPFRQFTCNPSAEIARLLDGTLVHGHRVTSQVLPVVFGEDVPPVVEAIERLRPAAVILLGLNSGATCIEVERFAVNLRTTDVPEEQVPILGSAPLAYPATLPLEAAVRAIRAVGTPGKAHAYAGAYLCNHLFFSVLHHLMEQRRSTPCGFLHLPHHSEHLAAASDGGYPSLPLASLTAAVEACIGACVRANDR